MGNLLNKSFQLASGSAMVVEGRILGLLLQMFKVVTREFLQEFDRWTDALNTAKSLMPKCKWFQDVRILEDGELVWIYSRSHKYPQFVGAGTYDRLAKRFLLEAMDEETLVETNNDEESSS
jgi:hypothetical protein